MNLAIFVGRIVAEPSLKTLESGTTVSNITIAVPRDYKNEDNVYETDFIDCSLWNKQAENTAQYCRKGDLILVAAKVNTKLEEKEGEKRKYTNINADKIVFLSSSRNKEQTHTHDDFEEEMDR